MNSTKEITRHEWAYFLFEKTEIDLELSSPDCVLPAAGDWLNVTLQQESSESLTLQDNGTCKLCTFALRVVGDCLNLCLGNIPMHDGQLKTQACTCGRRRPGSDILCSLGMLKFCEELVQIQNIRVFFWDYKYASVVITVDFPYLREAGRRSIWSGSIRGIQLHPATQALLASLRSDWEYLDMFSQEMVNLKKNVHTILKGQTSEPAQLTLEEVYKHMNDSQIAKEILRRQIFTKKESASGLTHLSTDIWTDHISPFLDAKALHALRQSCSELNTVLQAVIPGLKLRLFKHQKRSLTWMRSRETRMLTESELCRTNSRTRIFSVEGDDYRASSGGVATLLELRSTGEQVRIHQISGRECDESLVRLERTVARGGLLCDDPGLGKTITVLSLILQTAGMLPTLPTNTKSDRAAGNDKLFNAYWKEQYGVYENQRAALLRLTNSFLRAETSYGNNLPAKILQKLAEQRYEKLEDFQNSFE